MKADKRRSKQATKQAALSFLSCALLTRAKRNCKNAYTWHRIVDDIYTDDETGCGRLAKRLWFASPTSTPPSFVPNF
jgi:hypothetical protein